MPATRPLGDRPEEWNVIVDPKHKDHPRLTATKERQWLYDPKLAG